MSGEQAHGSADASETSARGERHGWRALAHPRRAGCWASAGEAPDGASALLAPAGGGVCEHSTDSVDLCRRGVSQRRVLVADIASFSDH